MIKDVQGVLSTGTQGQYKKQWAKFRQFMSEVVGKTTTEATQNHVSLYVTYLHNQSIKASTIRSHLSAIAFNYKLKSKASPTESFHTSKLLTAYSKTDVPVTVRKPITHKLLNKMVQAVEVILESRYDKILFVALFTLMYSALLRVSEVTKSKKNNHNIKRSQISVLKRRSSKELVVNFVTFKHSRESKKIAVAATSKSCPVEAYKKLQKVMTEKGITPSVIRMVSLWNQNTSGR